MLHEGRTNGKKQLNEKKVNKGDEKQGGKKLEIREGNKEKQMRRKSYERKRNKKLK